MARRSPTGRFPALRQGQRRETLWFGIGEGIVTLAAANTAILTNSLNAAALALRPFTIIRTYIQWAMMSDQLAALEDQQVGLGCAVVSDQASAIGVTAVPTPFTDLSSDLWYVHRILTSRFVDTGTAVEVAPNPVHTLVESKAMRKVEDGQDVITVMENSSISAGSRSLIAGRSLIKLH